MFVQERMFAQGRILLSMKHSRNRIGFIIQLFHSS